MILIWNRIPVLILLLTSLGVTTWVGMDPVQAHPLGNFTINHYAGIQINPNQIEIDYVLDMAEIPAFQTIQHWDPGHNQQPSPELFQSFQTEKCQQIQRDLRLSLNQNPLWLQVKETSIAFPLGVGGLSTLRLGCQLVAQPVLAPSQAEVGLPLEDPTGDRSQDPEPIQLQFLNQVDPHRLGWREITVTSQAVPIQTALPATSLTHRLQDYPTDLLSSPLDQRQANVTLYPQASAVNATDSTSTTGAATGSLLGRQGDPLTQLLTLKTMDPLTIAVALMIAFIWGGFHALTPGHGKTLVGAYLVGSQGTARHALGLGLTTTITHTASIFILGFVALAASQILITEQLYSWLSLLSGGTVIAIGGYLLRRRWQDFDHTHQDHFHHHDHSQDPLDSGDLNHEHLPLHAHTHDHKTHYHRHDHIHKVPEKMSLSGLLAIGISGGLLPCPSALLVMLGSIGLGQIGFGLALVTAFSLGLATVLTGIGLLLIYAQHWIRASSFKFPVWRGWPAVSALMVVVIGLGMTIRAIQQLMVL